MRSIVVAFGLICLSVLPVRAQSEAPPAAPTAAESAQPRRQTMAMRFAEANLTHDGHLTFDQAKAGFPAMARLFDAIDHDHKGYLTMDDIHAYYEAKRAARHAAN